MYELTVEALEKMMRGVKVVEPVLQVLGYNNLSVDENSPDRYRLQMSDGQKMSSLIILTTQLNHLVTNGILKEYTICEITNYQLITVDNNGRKNHLILILSINVLGSGNQVGYKIGNPTRLETNAEPQNYNAANNISTIPIAALNPYQHRWVIKVCVTSKSSIKTSNSRGEDKLFSMDLTDESGEIRCTAFKDQCDKFYDMIQVGNLYYISQGSLNTANKQFNPLKNDYEMRMTSDTLIVPCHENNDDIPTLQFNFCPLSELENKKKNDLIDVLGVVKTVSDVQHIQHTTGIKVVKRDVNIVDDSGTMVCVTLWRKQAEDFDDSNTETPIILAIKGALVSEFNGGKKLSLIISSVLKKDPDLPEAHRLRGWYTAGGH